MAKSHFKKMCLQSQYWNIINERELGKDLEVICFFCSVSCNINRINWERGERDYCLKAKDSDG